MPQDKNRESAPGRLNFADLYCEMRPALLRFAFRFFSKPQEVEDVVQEAFIKVIEMNERRDIEHPRSYMFQTVKNLSLKQLDKAEHRLTDTLGDFSAETVSTETASIETASLEEQFESRQKFELFCRAVRRLPVKCQRVYILRRVYGFSQKEIAERLDISLKTVEAHLGKAIVRCTDFMESQGYDNMGDKPARRRTRRRSS